MLRGVTHEAPLSRESRALRLDSRAKIGKIHKPGVATLTRSSRCTVRALSERVYVHSTHEFRVRATSAALGSAVRSRLSAGAALSRLCAYFTRYTRREMQRTEYVALSLQKRVKKIEIYSLHALTIDVNIFAENQKSQLENFLFYVSMSLYGMIPKRIFARRRTTMHMPHVQMRAVQIYIRVNYRKRQEKSRDIV